MLSIYHVCLHKQPSAKLPWSLAILGLGRESHLKDTSRQQPDSRSRGLAGCVSGGVWCVRTWPDRLAIPTQGVSWCSQRSHWGTTSAHISPPRRLQGPSEVQSPATGRDSQSVTFL
jgi:hypothetical protein